MKLARATLFPDVAEFYNGGIGSGWVSAFVIRSSRSLWNRKLVNSNANGLQPRPFDATISFVRFFARCTLLPLVDTVTFNPNLRFFRRLRRISRRIERVFQRDIALSLPCFQPFLCEMEATPLKRRQREQRQKAQLKPGREG